MATHTQTRIAATSGLAMMGLMTLSHFANDGWTALLSPLLPAIQASYGVSIADTAVLVAILAFAGSMLQPLLGILGDHIDRRLLAAFGPVLTGAGLTLIGYAPNFFVLGALVLLGGLGSAIFHPSGAAYIALSARPDQRGLFVSLFSAGGMAGMALSPLVAAAMSLRTLPLLLPVGIVLGVVTYLILPPSQRAAGQSRTLGDYLAVFRGPLRWLWLMSVLRSLSSVSYMSLIGFILQARGADAHTSPSLAVYNLASAIGGIIGGRLSDRIGRTVVLRSSILITIPLFLGLIYSSPSQWWYYPLTALVGALVTANIPVSIVTAQEYAPHNIATASALMMGFAWGTAGVLYLLIGKLADATSPVTAMAAAIAVLLPAFFITTRLPEPQRTTSVG
ncbi:MAG TPA: MFS transporter [Herpetosiphonaceae bacterium]|nr:MFS transporter [Herpetosiphonaceae bacterium]